MSGELFKHAWDVLKISSYQEKVEQTYALYEKYAGLDNNAIKSDSAEKAQSLVTPGRPEKPQLVLPKDLPRRSMSSLEGRAALIHAICHIEFNAINLALDAVYRFREMPKQYYLDWLLVAKEEAYHFSLLSDYLIELNFSYGDFPSHNGLWEMAVETDHDVLVRMALVPRVLEARGLDVTPGIMKKFESINDTRALEILAIIQKDEIGHVEIGSRWFRYCCEQRKLDHDVTFRKLLKEYLKSNIKKPINYNARLQAGFTQAELDYLEQDI